MKFWELKENTLYFTKKNRRVYTVAKGIVCFISAGSLNPLVLNSKELMEMDFEEVNNLIEPTLGEDFYFIGRELQTRKDTYLGHRSDINLIEENNFFTNEEDAYKCARKMQMLLLMEQWKIKCDIKAPGEDWEDNTKLYMVFYNNTASLWDVKRVWGKQGEDGNCNVYTTFNSLEVAEELVGYLSEFYPGGI